MTIEYRVKPVERYIITRHEKAPKLGPDTPGQPFGSGPFPTGAGSTTQIGNEFDSHSTAYAVAYALARKEQEDLGLMPGDMGVIFPELPK